MSKRTSKPVSDSVSEAGEPVTTIQSGRGGNSGMLPPPSKVNLSDEFPDRDRFRRLRLISANEVADLLGKSMRTLRRMVSDGVLPPPVKVGRPSGWREIDLETWMANGGGEWNGGCV